MQKIVLGGGCFWCIESVYNEMKGVITAHSGYMGGHTSNPDYQSVCSGVTGHAEVVLVEFDNQVVSLEEILKVFWTIHDPTTLNRQGNDKGTQYRSCIFYYTEDQKATIEKSIEEVAQEWYNDAVVTQVLPAESFYKAEDYHQNYFKNNPYQPYCVYVVNPKVQKFRSGFRDMLK
jgi:peptide-methionine (S)-S-oxide reductase